MPKDFVLDCSVAMSWCFQDETNEYTEDVLSSLETSKAFVPLLWKLEVSNVLLMAQNRNRINDNGIFHFLSLLEELPIEIDFVELTMKDTILLGQKHQLTAYDAAYLNLALYRNIPIATLDKKLRQAATDSSVGIFRL
jgi:predicted nucleic acid-binding protein